MTWLKGLKDFGPIVLSLAAILVMVGVYKNTVDSLEARVAKLEAQPRVLQPPVDPRVAECARLASEAYGDGSMNQMDNRTDILMLRLGCDQR